MKLPRLRLLTHRGGLGELVDAAAHAYPSEADEEQEGDPEEDSPDLGARVQSWRPRGTVAMILP
jgi:hypothetical protein